MNLSGATLCKIGILPFLKGIKPGSNGQLMALCPLHDDIDPSLSVNKDSGQWHCFGCGESGNAIQFYARLKGIDERTAIAELLSHNPEAASSNGGRIVAKYDYHDEEGLIRYQVVRTANKHFWQRRPDGRGGWINNLEGTRRVLYRLPEILATGDLIFITEGEADCDRLRQLGLITTTNPGGAGKWREAYNEYLRGKEIVLLPDNDHAGRRHVNQVAQSLAGTARTVKIVALPGLPGKGDISDWLDAGHGKEELLERVRSTPEFDSSAYKGVTADKRENYCFRSAAQILTSAPEPTWLWHGLIAEGMLSFLGGRAKCGKSTLMFALIRALLHRTEFLGMECKKSSVVLLTEENDASVGEKLKRFGLAEEGCAVTILTRNGITGRPLLADVMERAEIEANRIGAKLVILDTLAFWAGIRGEGENQAGTMSEALYPVLALTAQRFAVLIIHHTTKRGNDLRGSSSIEASADIIVTLHREPERRNRRRLETIGRFRETPDALLIELEDTDYIVLGAPQDVMRNEREITILKMLSENGEDGMSQGGLATVTGFSKQRISEAIGGLLKRGKIRRAGTGKRGDPYRYQIVDTPTEAIYKADRKSDGSELLDP